EAIATVVPVERLRFLALSHFEDDECGGIDELLARAPQAVPLSSRTNAMINGGAFTRDVRGIADGEALALGRHRVRWLDAPHLPHAWECGYLFEETTRTLLCGDLFTQGGSEHPPLTSADILGPSEEFRRPMDYYAHGRDTRRLLEHLAATRPTTLACMHGAAWQGDGAALLRALADSLAA
ncbi:MAG TPA: MBL fold metallo-hydrolase, partial [Candidatus Bathyarchaeia archaeon]|nr:MBL fold metallo-hydrolase [Candidatus Bathyarchaeia archaeon]